MPFDAPLDAVPADEQLPAVPSVASAGSAGGSSGDGSGSGKADAAKGAAQDVAGDAKEQAANVAGTAKEQASKVASEATDHAKQLYGQASENLKQQAGEQQQRAAGGLRSLGEQLGRMAENDDEQGVASKVVRDLSGRATSAAGFLENRDPGSLLDEVKTFAAKRPGTFIAIAAGAGLLAGRLTKALATEVKHEKEAGDGTTGSGSGVWASPSPARHPWANRRPRSALRPHRSVSCCPTCRVTSPACSGRRSPSRRPS